MTAFEVGEDLLLPYIMLLKLHIQFWNLKNSVDVELFGGKGVRELNFHFKSTRNQYN